MEKLMIKRENYIIPAILETCESMKCFVILCHGTGSSKDEVGNMFESLAKELLKNNIGSIRMDFADCGERINYNEKVSFFGQVEDVKACYDYVLNLNVINKDKIGILGFSQGARIMCEFINIVKDMKFAISWSGACLNGIEEFQGWFDEYYEEAKENGFINMELGFRKPLCLSLKWFNEIKTTNSLDVLKEFKNPILGIAGNNDDVVPYYHTFKIYQTSDNKLSKCIIFENADHIFNILGDDSKADAVINETVNWINNILEV